MNLDNKEYIEIKKEEYEAVENDSEEELASFTFWEKGKSIGVTRYFILKELFALHESKDALNVKEVAE